MADKNRKRESSYNQSNDDWNENSKNYKQQYRGRDPRYDEQYSSADRDDYNRVNYVPDNDENRSYNDQHYEDTNYGSSGTYGHRGDYGSDYNSGQGKYSGNIQNRNEYNRRMDSGSGGRKMSTNYGNDYQGWGGYNDDYREDRNRYTNTGSSNMGERGYRSGYNEGYGSTGRIYDDRDRNYNMSRRDYDRDYHGTGYNRDRDWWDRSRDEVSSWFGDRDAERRRDMDKTMGEHRGKGPRGYKRSEDRIREDVCDRLTFDDRVDASDIDVKVEGTEVVLSGTVHSREEKRRAEDLAEAIPGVQNVENRIHISNRDIITGERTTGDVETGTTNEIIRDTNEKRNWQKNK